MRDAGCEMWQTAPASPVACAPGVRAFTLLELLMVMSLIAVLASIVLVVGRGISERSKVAQAKAEMAVLAAALEQYKQQYGDYPWTPEGLTSADGELDGGALLFNALCGNTGPKGNRLEKKGRTFVEIERFNIALSDRMPNDAGTSDATELKRNWFNDPWGEWYWYYYRPDGYSTDTWKTPGFLLYSHGPDMACTPGTEETTGLVSDVPDVPVNADNIYHGRD